MLTEQDKQEIINAVTEELHEMVNLYKGVTESLVAVMDYEDLQVQIRVVRDDDEKMDCQYQREEVDD